MKKLVNITLTGTCLFLAGITITLTEIIGVYSAKIITLILFTLGGIFSILFSKANKEREVASKFQLIQGVGLIISVVVIISFSNSLLSFLMSMAYFILLFGLFEILFSFSVLNSKNRIHKSILTYRIVAGFITSIGAMILLLTTFSSEYMGLMFAGFLTLLIGLSNIIFAERIKRFL